MESEQASEDIVLEPKRNRFANAAFWCGIGSACGLVALYSPLMAVIPLVSLAGFIAGIAGLILSCRPDSPYDGLHRAWIGCVLCAIAFGVTGYFFAAFMNYAHSTSSDQRQIALALQVYAENHGGYLPESLNALDAIIPGVKRSRQRYHFYFVYTTHPYVLNGYLAGKNIRHCAYPSQTLLTAEARDAGATVFYDASDINLQYCSIVTFLDGHDEGVDQERFNKHLPANGKVTEKTWLLKPRWRR